jgi:hypothetical protein
MKRKFLAPFLVVVVYSISYLMYRSAHVETWRNDGKDYLIFPEEQRWVYYLFRPATYVDGALTGMQFHIGPHR